MSAALVAIALSAMVVCAARAQAPLPAPRTPNIFDAALRDAAQLPRLHSLLVSWRGELVLERYFNRIRPTQLANIKSASKSIISALVGIAIDRSLIPGVRQPISAFFPDLLTTANDPEKRQISIEDLLTMRSGLETTSNRNYGAWVQSRNWVRHALGRPLLSDPGTQWQYSTGNTHLLSAILTKASGTSTWQFAQEALAKPLGFTLAKWPQDPQGIYFGGNDMLMTPRQMVAFGTLYLNRGRVNDQRGQRGRQVISSRWVETSFVPRTRSRISEQHYGYGWWIRELAGQEAVFAWGFGGQYIVVVPDLDLVVVTTSAATVSENVNNSENLNNSETLNNDERRRHRRTVFDIVEQLIIAPVAEAE